MNWWKAKAKEIYTLIPDFGGFLVKANSEGQSGPQDYGRTHADGANLLADAVKPYGGNCDVEGICLSGIRSGSGKTGLYRIYAARWKIPRQCNYSELKMAQSILLPREPFSPLFGAMKKNLTHA